MFTKIILSGAFNAKVVMISSCFTHKFVGIFLQ